MGAVSYPRVQPDPRLARRRAVEHVLLGAFPVIFSVWVAYHIFAGGIAAVDFRHSFWVAGWRTLHGMDPYTWTRQQISGGVSFPYPAPTALLMAPFGLVASMPVSIVITAAAVLAAPLSLWILEVRDWRVYGAVTIWAPVVVAWQTANFTLPLVVGVAMLWRWRDRPSRAALLIACLVSIKPIMAPLWIWLVFTRRWRAAALGAAITLCLNVVSWSVLGWHELGNWFSLISLQGKLQDGTGYSLIALSAHLGFGRRVGELLIVVVACALLGIGARLAALGRQQALFGVALLLTVVISPQADSHYFALLLVPLALARPRLSWEWLVPTLLWSCPATHSHTWQIVVWWALLAAVMWHVWAPSRRADPMRAGT